MKKKVSLARLIPFIKMRFMQEKLRTRKCLCRAFCVTRLGDSCLRLYQMVEEQVCV